jgi:transcriptional regulator with XRE-family HTH domain
MAAVRDPRPVDKHVGGRVRMRRLICGVTQVQLADKLGVTFQQVQKYEKGSNRIGASRLHQISQALDTPISFFFEGSPGSNGRASHVLPGYLIELMSTDVGQRLIQAMSRVTDAKMRNNLLELIESVTGHRSEPKSGRGKSKRHSVARLTPY